MGMPSALDNVLSRTTGAPVSRPRPSATLLLAGFHPMGLQSTATLAGLAGQALRKAGAAAHRIAQPLAPLDEGAAALFDPQNAFAGQGGDGIAHRMAIDVETFGQSDFARQRLLIIELAGADRYTDLVGDLPPKGDAAMAFPQGS